MKEVQNSMAKGGITVSSTIIAIVAIVAGILVIWRPDIAAIIIGIILILWGIWTLIKDRIKT